MELFGTRVLSCYFRYCKNPHLCFLKSGKKRFLYFGVIIGKGSGSGNTDVDLQKNRESQTWPLNIQYLFTTSIM